MNRFRKVEPYQTELIANQWHYIDWEIREGREKREERGEEKKNEKKELEIFVIILDRKNWKIFFFNLVRRSNEMKKKIIKKIKLKFNL